MSDKPKKPEEKRPKPPGTRRTLADTEIAKVTPDAEKKAKEEPKPESDEKKLPISNSWISGRTDDTLVSLITAFAQELKVRAQSATSRKLSDRPLPVIKTDAEVKEFLRLPASAKQRADETITIRRIILYSDKQPDKPIGIEIYDDVTLGRGTAEMKVDLDLTDYDAEELGVSRKHAMLRPTKSRLMLVDLGSTNGTYCEGGKVKGDAPVELKDGHTISLGKLHFKVKFASQSKPLDKAK